MLWIAILALAGCSDGAGRFDGALELERRGQASSHAAERAGATAVLGAEHIAAVQRQAGPHYAFTVDSSAATSSGRAWAENPAQRWVAQLEGGAVRIEPQAQSADWVLELRWTSLGRGARRGAVPQLEGGVEASRGRATFRRAGSEEWYDNGRLGLEQGFVLRERPLGHEQPLVLEVSVGGSLAPDEASAHRGVVLRDAEGRARLRYTDLHVVDAVGAELGAWMVVRAGAVELCVDDSRARYPVFVDPLIWSAGTKLMASDAEAGGYFGRSVALSGELALVGANRRTEGTERLGAAYVLGRDVGGTDAWGEIKTLTASDGAAYDDFGYSVDLDGDTAIVGAPRHDAGADQTGAAYVFVRDDGGTDNWGEVQKLVASTAATEDQFGTVVAISGDVAVVGAHRKAGYRGSAYVFERDAGGPNAWGEVAELIAPDASVDRYFGNAVDVSGDVIVVGEYRHWLNNLDRPGAAYVFSRDVGGPGNWGLVKMLIRGSSTDAFGYSVAINDTADTIVIGAPYDDNIGAQTITGSADIMERDEGGTDNWGTVTTLYTTGTSSDDQFGRSVGISGDLVIVGAFVEYMGSSDGAIFVYRRDEGGPDAWGQDGKLTPSDSDPWNGLGYAVAIQGTTVLAGNHLDSTVGSSSGAAYVFEGIGDVGHPCSDESECDSGFCADSVCCDSACDDECYACSVAAGAETDGVCAPVDDGTPCNGGTCQDGECEPSGTGGSGGTGTGGTGSGASAASGGTAATPGGDADEDSGCGCRTAGRRGSLSGASAMLLCVGLLLVRRRRAAAS